MKVLLIGGLGFIGKKFLKKYSHVYDVIIYDRKDEVLKIKGKEQFKNIVLEEGNVEEQKIFEILTKHKPNVIVHLAALTGLKKCHDNPEKAFKVNVFGTFNVLNACLKSNSKFIFISSREVYGETLKTKSIENDPLNPNNVYGVTKMLGEQLVTTISQIHGLDYTILRLTNVYGPEGDAYGAQKIIKDALYEKKIRILGGTQHLNYVYVDDVVDLINLVLNDKRSSKQVFNVGSNDTVTINEYVKNVMDLINEKVEIEVHPMRETETSNFVPDLTKLKNVLNYSTKISLREGIDKTIKWYSANNNNISNK